MGHSFFPPGERKTWTERSALSTDEGSIRRAVLFSADSRTILILSGPSSYFALAALAAWTAPTGGRTNRPRPPGGDRPVTPAPPIPPLPAVSARLEWAKSGRTGV